MKSKYCKKITIVKLIIFTFTISIYSIAGYSAAINISSDAAAGGAGSAILIADKTKAFATPAPVIEEALTRLASTTSSINIFDLQLLIHEHVKSLGGYWRPLSGLARVIEEFGEFCEAVQSESSLEEIGGELTDLFIITTCIANQYRADLKKEYASHGIPGNLREQYKPVDVTIPTCLSMAPDIGELARVINNYEGDKKLKAGAKVSTVENLVGILHTKIWGYASANGIDIVSHVSKNLAFSALRDKTRFVKLYDPTMTDAMENFSIIQKNIECPFAKRAKIWSAPDWNGESSIKDNIASLLPSFKRFLKIAPYEELDGFFICAPGEFGRKLEDLTIFLRNVLNILQESAPKEASTEYLAPSDSGWQFSYNNSRLFIITFAPCYSNKSSRYSYDIDRTFILFQPEHSFFIHKVPRGEEHGRLRESIRKSFAVHDKDYYDPVIMNSDLEAIRYIKPLRLGDKPVLWWE